MLVRTQNFPFLTIPALEALTDTAGRKMRFEPGRIEMQSTRMGTSSEIKLSWTLGVELEFLACVKPATVRGDGVISWTSY